MTTQAEELYAKIGSDGMVEQYGYSLPRNHLVGRTPVFQEQDLPG